MRARFDQLSSYYIGKHDGNKSIYGEKDTIVADGFVEGLTQTDTRRIENDKYIH
jgi:hypothetical protein